MDGASLFRVINYHFPTKSITLFFILANVVIQGGGYCDKVQMQLLQAILTLMSVIVLLVRFTDSYTASDGNTFWVLLIPVYGSICSNLPSEWDKEQVKANYFPVLQDYLTGFLASLCFTLVSIFCQPIVMCLFPNMGNPPAKYHVKGVPYADEPNRDGTSKFGRAIVAASPVFVALIAMLLFICLKPRRRMMGRANLVDTIPPPAFEFEEEPDFEAGSVHNTTSNQDYDSGRGSGSKEGGGGGARGGGGGGGGARGGGGAVELRSSGGQTWKGEAGAGRVTLGHDGHGGEEQNVASRSRSRVGGLEGGGASGGMGGALDSPLRRPARAAAGY